MVSLNIGKFHAFLKNAELTDSVALGELNASSFTSNFTGVYAGSIANYVEMAAPTDSFINNVSTESYAGINKCGVTNAMCDANPTVPVGYSSSYFTNPSGGSPSIQNWDFVNILESANFWGNSRNSLLDWIIIYCQEIYLRYSNLYLVKSI